MNGKVLALLTVVAMTGITLLMRAALEHWPIGLTGTVSRVFTVGTLACWVLLRGEGWRRLAPRGTAWWLVVMSINAILINVLLFTSLKWTTATNYAVLYRLDIVFVVLIGTLLGLERIGWRELTLLPVMLLGVAFVAEVRLSGVESHIVGDLMVVAGALGFAINAFILRQIFRTMDTEAVALINVSVTGLGFLGVMLIRGELATVGAALGEPIMWLWVALLGLSFGLYILIYYAALDRMPVWKLRTWMLTSPLLVALADWVLWNTRLSGQQWVGTGLVLLGLAGLIRLEMVARAATKNGAGQPELP
ncbi:MAG: DMT family transporter [Pirellulales bacterium]|nr:DMT family transporter [Pirellulales bacterium]